jgi:predicted amidohydrolase YtcJ
VRCAGGVVTHVGDAPPGADLVIDAAGGAVLPGLHDHHVHLMAMAAARASVDVSARGLDALADAPGDDWIRAVGYHESISGPLDRDRLDAVVADRPVRVQHRTGQLWVLNSVALRRTETESLIADGVERDGAGRATGRLFRLDELLRERIGGRPPDIGAAAAELAARGVTAVTDMTPAADAGHLATLAAAARSDGFAIDVAVTGAAVVADVDVGLPRGPVKVVLDDARLPSLDDLAGAFSTARRAGRAIAVHCVTRAELVLALAAWDVVGARPGDRIEHGGVVPVELLDTLRRHGLVVVTQPALVTARGDQYLADVDADDVAHLWRCGSLLRAGIGVAAGSDAPYGDADPWRAIAAARDRTTPAGVVLGPDERISARRALDLYLAPLDDPAGAPREVVAGAPADLCLLTEPLATALGDPATATVRTTIRGGVVVAGDS